MGWNDLRPELNSGVPGQQGLRSEIVRIARLRHRPPAVCPQALEAGV